MIISLVQRGFMSQRGTVVSVLLALSSSDAAHFRVDPSSQHDRQLLGHVESILLAAGLAFAGMSYNYNWRLGSYCQALVTPVSAKPPFLFSATITSA